MILRYTGNPFMDAALSSLIAAIGKVSPTKIELDDLKKAVDRLKIVLLSDPALGIGVEKSFNKGPLKQIFPNSKLTNSSIKDPKKEYEGLLNVLLDKASRELNSQGDKVCPICGRHFSEGEQGVKADKFPLFRGFSNFYPGLSDGLEICSLCALAIQFFPLSVLRTGERGRLWFVHTQNSELAVEIAKRYGWEYFERSATGRQTLNFYGVWDTAGEGGAILSLFYHLIREMPEREQEMFESRHSVTAYVFSNDNRTAYAYIRSIPIPHDVMIFMNRLRYDSPQELSRFYHELLSIPGDLKGKKRDQRARWVASTAWAILERKSILGHALDHKQPYLRGGWRGHRIYLKEVRKMPAWKIKLLESLGLQIAQSEDRKKWISILRNSSWRELEGVFLKFIQERWLNSHDFYLIAPPGGDFYLSEARDALLAVLYEYGYLEKEGKEFVPYDRAEEEPKPDEFYRKIEQIGARIIAFYPNPDRWVGDLRNVRKPQGIRGVYLNAIERGAMSWKGYIFLAPLDDISSLYLYRDYLLAYLLDQLSLSPKRIGVMEEVAQEH